MSLTAFVSVCWAVLLCYDMMYCYGGRWSGFYRVPSIKLSSCMVSKLKTLGTLSSCIGKHALSYCPSIKVKFLISSWLTHNHYQLVCSGVYLTDHYEYSTPLGVRCLSARPQREAVSTPVNSHLVFQEFSACLCQVHML